MAKSKDYRKPNDKKRKKQDSPILHGAAYFFLFLHSFFKHLPATSHLLDQLPYNPNYS